MSNHRWNNLKLKLLIPSVKYYIKIVMCIYSHLENYASCLTEYLPNSTHAIDQLLSKAMNTTDMGAPFNFICNSDITSNV